VGLYALAAEQRTSRRQRWKLLQRDQQQQQQEQSSEKGNKDTNNGVICRSVVGTSVAVGTFSSFDILDVEIGSEHPDEEEGGIVGENPPPAFVLDFRLRRDMTHARTYFEPTKRRKLEKTNREDNRIIQEGAHYMRYALAVYGHLMYMFQQPCTAPCRLACDFVTGKISHCCFSKGHEMKNTVVGDNFLGCNKSAFLQISDIDEEDVIYMSFKNAINVLPYVILVDREKNAVVLAIRGTFSLEGLVTDFRIRPEPLDNYQVQYPGLGGTIDTEGEFCHSGFLHSALAIYEDLERHQILNRLLLGDSSQLPGFSLVLTGHSLGAGCAAVLSLMLRTKFDGLQCYCFSPPGCVFSDKASSQDHIVSYVLDSDIVPCLSLHSMNGLRDDILLMIARLKIPKHEVWKKVSKSDNDAEYESWTSGLAHSRESIPDSAFYRHLLDFLRMQVTLQENHQIASVQLRPPGKMVHLIASHNQGSSFFDRAPRQKTYVPVYAERSDFSEIQITRSFLYYHDPFLVLTQLQRIADVFK
jgi:sn1-specific diacylglycerol lipase